MSTRAVPWRTVALPVGGAVVLVGATTPVLDRWSEAVLRGAVLLLAVAAAAAVDEPSARLLDASPTTFAHRVLQRLLVVALVVGPAAAACAAWSAARGGSVPGLLWLELATLVVGAVATSAALRRWTAVAEPAVLTGPLLVGGVLLLRGLAPVLPDVDLTAGQGWTLALAGAAALWLLALQDPATAAQRRVPLPR